MKKKILILKDCTEDKRSGDGTMTTDLNDISKRGYKEIIEMTDPFKWKYLPRVIAKKKLGYIKDDLEKHKCVTLLDIGCGNGVITKKFKHFKIVGLDNYIYAIREARMRGLDVIIGDTYNLPFKSNSFDATFMIDTLEHLEYPEKALSEAVRVARKLVIVTVPNKTYIHDLTTCKTIFNYTRLNNLLHQFGDAEIFLLANAESLLLQDPISTLLGVFSYVLNLDKIFQKLLNVGLTTDNAQYLIGTIKKLK